MMFKKILSNNKSVISNYFNLTFLQVLNSFFYLLIYPFVIKSVGLESYGEYIFFNSISLYFYIIVSYGFDIHGAKFVALNISKPDAIAKIFEDIFFLKVFIFIFSSILFVFILIIGGFSYKERLIASTTYLNVISAIFLTSWYFHGAQKLYLSTAIQLLFKIFSLPLIFIFLNERHGVEIYSLIISLINISSSLVLFFISANDIKKYRLFFDKYRCIALLKEVQPYFWSTACIAVKQRSIELIIGSTMGMRELSLYDLAYKIFSIPNLLISNINAALFPKIISEKNKSKIKSIIFFEILIGVFVIFGIIIFGQWFIKLVFGDSLMEAYGISILLSINIFAYLIVGAYIYFIFIPRGDYGFILKNQIVSLLSFYALCCFFYFYSWDVYFLLGALIFSGIVEILFCKYRILKNGYGNV